MRNGKAIAIGAAVVAVSLGLLFYYGSTTAARNAEERITQRLRALNSCEPTVTPLEKIVGSDYKEVCVQPPYMTQEGFEAKSGRKLSGYQPIDDKWTVWWLIPPSGEPLAIRLSRGEFVEEEGGAIPLCHPVKTTSLIYQCKRQWPAYQLKGD